MKNNAVALSFGYLATKKRQTRRRHQNLIEIDLFEITVTPGPANPETRFLSMKAVADLPIPTDAELRVKAKRLGLKPPLSRRELRRAGERRMSFANRRSRRSLPRTAHSSRCSQETSRKRRFSPRSCFGSRSARRAGGPGLLSRPDVRLRRDQGRLGEIEEFVRSSAERYSTYRFGAACWL